MSDYLTVEKYAQEEYIINRSRFIGYVTPVTSSEQAIAFINEIKAKHRDATHNVYAYVVKSPEYSRYSDDGEPQGTAGMPTLDVIKKSGVTDCCIVVTRYFGGILLGAGGLVRAYAHTAGLALHAGGIIKMSLCQSLSVCCDYAFYDKLTKIALNVGAQTEESFFGENVTVNYLLADALVPDFCQKLTEESNGRVQALKTGEKYGKIKI